MKKQLHFKFTQSFFIMTAFTVLSFFAVQSSYAQKWNIIGDETAGTINISSVASYYTSITVVGDVPYLVYVEGGTTGGTSRVKKRNTDGTWSQVGTNNPFGSTSVAYTRIFSDSTGKLYVGAVDKTGGLLSVATLDVNSVWVRTNISVNPASYTGPSDSRFDVAFDTNNVPYIAYSERPTTNLSGNVSVKRFVGGLWENVGSVAATADTFAAAIDIALDANNVPYLVYINQALVNSNSGPLKAYRYNSGTSLWDDITPPSNMVGTTLNTVIRYTTITMDADNNPVVCYFNTSNSNRSTIIRYNKATSVWDSPVTTSTRDAYSLYLINDTAGNLYNIFADALISGGISSTVRVFKKANGTSVFNELQNLPITSPSGVGIDATGPNDLTVRTPKIATLSIAVGSNTSKPYIVYTKTNSGGIVTPIVRLFDATTTWNGSAWSNGAPTATAEAIIDGTYSTTTNGTITAKKLTVNTGKSLTINTGTTVTVQNEVISDGSTVVENNANLVQVNGTTNTNTGNIVVNRNSNALSRLDYTLWSSPVAGQKLVDFSPLTSQNPSRFYTYDSASSYTAIAIPTLTTTNFADGTGYLIRMPNTAVPAPSTETFAGQFTGVPNNGDISFTLSTAGSGYNLVGNPYPSPITAATLVANNSAVISTTMYFWRKTNGLGTAYCTYNTTGSVFTTNGNAQSVDPAGVIQTGQGFFVQAIAPGSLVFKNGQRAANTTGQFFKTKQVATSDKIWLNATNTAGDFSQMAVNYTEGATQGVDAYDGKYINDSPVALTSNINNEEYTIQGRPAFDASDVVPLNFKTAVAGNYTIAIDHSEGVFTSGQSVILADATTGTETDLTTSSYTFTAATGTANSRFSLKYQKTLGTNKAVLNDNNVSVYKSKGTLYVNSGEATIANIKVYDVQGRLMAELKNVKATSATIANLKATNQVLVVKITSQDNKVVTKKVVN